MNISRSGFCLELPIVIPLLAMLGEVPKSWRDTDSPLQYNQDIFQRQGVEGKVSYQCFSSLNLPIAKLTQVSLSQYST